MLVYVKKKKMYCIGYRLWNACKYGSEAQNILLCCFAHLQVFLSC